MNYYTPFRVGAADGRDSARSAGTAAFPGAPAFTFAPRQPLTDMGWEVDADRPEEVLLTAAARLPGVPLRVTENGAAFPDDERAADGAVDDEDRISYLRDHLAAVERARASGVARHGLRGLVAARQLRVGAGLHADVRAGRGRARHAAPRAQGVVPLVRRARPLAGLTPTGAAAVAHPPGEPVRPVQVRRGQRGQRGPHVVRAVAAGRLHGVEQHPGRLGRTGLDGAGRGGGQCSDGVGEHPARHVDGRPPARAARPPRRRQRQGAARRPRAPARAPARPGAR